MGNADYKSAEKRPGTDNNAYHGAVNHVRMNRIVPSQEPRAQAAQPISLIVSGQNGPSPPGQKAPVGNQAPMGQSGGRSDPYGQQAPNAAGAARNGVRATADGKLGPPHGTASHSLAYISYQSQEAQSSPPPKYLRASIE
jgi:hypothetical protein